MEKKKNKKNSNQVNESEIKANKDITEILGRPIRLADILFAIENNNKCSIEYTVFSDLFTMIHYEKPDEQGYCSTCYWNLKDDLRDQREETINFIYELLYA